MNTLMVTYAGYEYLLTCEGGNHYTATCQRTGRIKTRLNPNLWHNRHNGLVTDAGMIEAFEHGVRELQRMVTPKGQPKPTIISGHSAPPRIERKGLHKTNREPKGRAE